MSDKMGSSENIEAIDIGVIVVYFVVVIGFGIWVNNYDY